MPPTLHDPHGNQPAAAALTQLHILMPHNTRLPTDWTHKNRRKKQQQLHTHIYIYTILIHWFICCNWNAFSIYFAIDMYLLCICVHPPFYITLMVFNTIWRKLWWGRVIAIWFQIKKTQPNHTKTRARAPILLNCTLIFHRHMWKYSRYSLSHAHPLK